MRVFAMLDARFALLILFAQRSVRLALDVLSASAQASVIVVAAALVGALAAALIVPTGCACRLRSMRLALDAIGTQ
jgi:uncharacterized integral membrane protein